MSTASGGASVATSRAVEAIAAETGRRRAATDQLAEQAQQRAAVEHQEAPVGQQGRVGRPKAGRPRISAASGSPCPAPTDRRRTASPRWSRRRRRGLRRRPGTGRRRGGPAPRGRDCRRQRRIASGLARPSSPRQVAAPVAPDHIVTLEGDPERCRRRSAALRYRDSHLRRREPGPASTRIEARPAGARLRAGGSGEANHHADVAERGHLAAFDMHARKGRRSAPSRLLSRQPPRKCSPPTIGARRRGRRRAAPASRRSTPSPGPGGGGAGSGRVIVASSAKGKQQRGDARDGGFAKSVQENPPVS